MAITYSIGPNPKWYIADLVGRPLGGGSMFTFRSLDKTQPKAIFTDPAGNFPWPNPVLFDENGSQGPLYWEVDSLNPQETYYIEVYDANGVLQWTQDDYLPNSGAGGGDVTEGIDLENLIINNVMWRNFGVSTNPIASTAFTIAPGCHAGLALTSSNAGPDIVFLKNNTAAVDQLQFINFTLGSNALSPDVTPVQYLNYASNAAAGETQKCVQYPITNKVQNLTNQTASVSIWARCNSGNTALTLQWRTFYGDGSGASPDDITPIQTLTLTSSWAQYNITTTVPDVTGKTLGGCGNDALFLQVQYPLSAATNIDYTKPSVFLGTIVPTQNFHLNDQIDGVLNVPRTGAIRTTMLTTVDLGWVLMNDGTIGSSSSNATTRADIDTFPLYNLIWNSVPNSYAQLYDSSGNPINRGASAVADFIANNKLSLTKSLGRALSNAGTASTGSTNFIIGQIFGSETNTLVANNLPAHTHALSGFTGDSNNNGGPSGTSDVGTTLGSRNTLTNTTTNTPVNNIQPTQYQNFMIKL